ncbi:MAG: cation:proton antiporter [Deltaproteobacteria bacterium]|nr:cation:proton antiporter [Deltaproteobacteria bacterium]
MDLHLVLRDLAVVLAIATAVALLFGRLHLSVVAAFLVAGAILGPTGAGLVSEPRMVDALAEIGVALLLFTVGLEISLSSLGKMRRQILMAGGIQVAATVLLSLVVLVLAGFHAPVAVFMGFVLSLSSTAIVLKLYADRMEIDSGHGRISTGILLFQDMAVIPMMLLVPSLRQWETAEATTVLLALLKAGVGVAAILFLARFVIPLLLKEVIRLNSREILAMTVLCLILGTAYIAQMWGLSLAMGAFLAGIVISESEYVHEIAAQIFPFRDVFNGVFFISVGMLLNLPFLAGNLPEILLMSIVVVLGKAVCAGCAIRSLKYPWRVSVIGAVGLGQVGEFSFLLLSQGFREGLVGTVPYQNLLAIAILTMVGTPFLVGAAPRIARFWGRYVVKGIPEPGAEEEDILRQEIQNHVIIAGYGMNGKNLARVLRATRVPYVVAELNDALVREAREAGEPIFFGDVNNPEILDRLGTANDVDDLIALGANAVIPEEFETSVEIFSRVLHEYHVPDHVIRQQEELIRSGTYRMLRERTPGQTEEVLAEFEEFLRRKVIEVFYISPDSIWAGRAVSDLPVGNGAGIVLLAVLREERAIIQPAPGETVAPGDKLVLFGGHAPLAAALLELTRGSR